MAASTSCSTSDSVNPEIENSIGSNSSSESESESSFVEQESKTVSLLSRLRAPTKSYLSRKGKILTNPPVGKKRSSHSVYKKSKEPKVKPSQRVKEFPNEYLCLSAGELFCDVCRERLSVKRSTVKNHVTSTKHAESKAKNKKGESRDGDIVKALKQYDEKVNPVGQTLSPEQRLYRIKVVMTMLKAGIPLSKLDVFRDLLEEKATRLTDTRQMYDLIPFILEQEKHKIQSEIKDKHISFVFDGTSRLGEVLAIILRYVDNWEVKQCLVQLEMLTKSMSAEEIARELINVFSVSYGIKSHLLVASMRDGASVNEVAMRVIKVVYNNILDVRCFSHTLDLVGEKFKLPVLVDFSTAWISLFSHSPKTKALWKEQTGKAMASLSKTRWWSRWEIFKQILVQFSDVIPFLQNNTDVGPALRPKLLAMVSDNRTLGLLKMELATVVDVGESFVSGTYKLEGDGLLAITCFEEIERIKTSLTVSHYPNMAAIANTLAPGNSSVFQQWITYGMNCVQPGIDYFHSKFANDSSPPLNAFKAARLVSPLKVNDLKPVAADIDSLKCIPILNNSETIENLKKELPSYLAKCNGISSDVDVFNWFKRNESELSHWSAAFKLLVLIQPSSAATERVFSLLNALFSSSQINSLEDYVETSIILQYNNR